MSLNLKRNYPILIALILVLAVITAFLGSQRVIAYTTQIGQAAEAGNEIEGFDYQNDVDLFDDAVVHCIQVIMDEEDYQTMISTYQQTGEKDYFHADVIIDGVHVTNVGIRLKGNASLQTALGGRGSGGGMVMNQVIPQGGQPGGFDVQATPQFVRPDNLPEGFTPQSMPEGGMQPDFPENVEPGDLPEGAIQPDFPQGAVPGGGFIFQGQGTTVSASGEVKIPYLIKFDEFVSGQTYQGHTRLSLRTYGVTYDEAMLAEPLTNYAFELMGMPATETAFAGIEMNAEAEELYVISEVVDDPIFLERIFSYSNGVLYKAEVGSSLSYVGDDPSSYAQSFSQESRINDADMAPLIKFSQFLSESDDVTFEEQLPRFLDIDSFATYLALTNLLVNNDSIAGMDNNYYLYYDDQAGYFTLLYWDGNESLGGLGMGTSANFDLYFQEQGGMRSPGGGENILLQRFMENTTFLSLYEEKLQEVYRTIFLSRALAEKTEAYSALIHSVNEARSLVTIDVYDQAVNRVLIFINDRMEYLDSTGLME